jgi:hypothetical protein
MTHLPWNLLDGDGTGMPHDDINKELHDKILPEDQ